MSLAVDTAAELIRIINPRDLDNIRMLFSGNLINLELFTRTIQTFIPKCYLETEDYMNCIASAIIDFFEEMDSDADGFITWADFISFYSEASYEPQDPQMQLPETQLVFYKIQRQSDASSGKTGKVVVESAIPNNAEIKDLKGTRIESIYIYKEQYYLITDMAVYKTDNYFLFCDLIFEPTVNVLKGSEAEKKIKLKDYKTREKEEKTAISKLERFGIETTKIDFHSGPKMPKKEIKFDRNALLNGIGRKTITYPSPIACSIVLDPLPLLIICMTEPLFIFVSLSGTLGTSDPVRLASAASSLYWCARKSTLYIGHNNGAISAFQIRLQRKKHSIMQQLEELNQLYQYSSDPIAILKRLITEKQCTLADLTKDDWIAAYPELRQLTFDVDENATNQAAKLEKRRALYIYIQQLMHLSPEDLEIVHLVTEKIFNPHISTMDNHNIKLAELIKSDPIAYFEAMTQFPNPLQTAIKRKKHGGVQIDVDATFLFSKYVVEESVRKLAGDFGYWEQDLGTDHFRLVVAGGGGTLTICDEFLNVVTTFPSLHYEGVISIYVVYDNIASVGYENVYLIDRNAIYQAYIGNCVLPEEPPDLSTSQHGLLSEKARSSVDTSAAKLLEGDKLKTQTHIRKIKPPRPGFPIVTSFYFGNVVCVIDHDYVVTMFHAISGAHLSRTLIYMPIASGLKFGECFYNFYRDVGFLPVGKHILAVRAVPNEPLESEYCAWGILEDIDKEEKRTLGYEIEDETPQKGSTIPIGSISRDVVDVAINQQIHEFAAITADFYITFYSLLTGRPLRVIDIAQISRQLCDDSAEQQPPTEYHTIETNDQALYFTENYAAASAENVCVLSERKRKDGAAIEKNAQDLIHEQRVVKSSIPYFLDPLQQLYQKQKHDLLRILGQRVLALQTDIKNRILFVIGTKGIITIYWKTGCLFDYTQVSILGKNLLADASDYADSYVRNPFKQSDSQTNSQMRVASDDSVVGFDAYSLNVDLSQMVVREGLGKRASLRGVSRYIIAVSDPQRSLLFIYDFLNPQEVRVINSAPVAELSKGPVNSRIIFNLNITFAQTVLDPCYKLKNTVWQLFAGKPVFLGEMKGVLSAEQQARFAPDTTYWGKHGQIEQIYSKEHYRPYFSRFLTYYLNPYLIEDLAAAAYVTVLAVSYEFSLLAIGTSDSRVQLFDTSSIKFLRYGTIYLPVESSAHAVTTISFLGNYPLIFIGLSGGYCYIYTVRPLIPSNVLVCSFRHSSYTPTNFPANINPYESFVRRARHTQRFAYFLTEESLHYYETLNYENEFIKQLFFFYAPETKNQSIFADDNACSDADNIFAQHHQSMQYSMARSAQQSSSQAMSQSLIGLAKLQVIPAFSNLDDATVIYTKQAFVNIPTSRLSVASTAAGTDIAYDDPDLVRHKTPKSAIPIEDENPLKSSSTSAVTSRAKQPYLSITSEHTVRMLYIAQTLFYFRTPRGIGYTILPIYMKYSRYRRLVIRIRAATAVIAAVRNVFGDFLQRKYALRISKEVADFERQQKLADYDEELDIMKMIQIKGDVPDTIKTKVQISKKTKKIIGDHLKSRFHRKEIEDEEAKIAFPYNATEYEKMELIAESKGYLLRRYILNGKELNIPVRKMALENLYNNVAATYSFFCERTGELLLGSDQGYVVKYDISKMLQQLAVYRVSFKTKTIYDVYGGEPQILTLGYAEQRVPTRLLSGELSGRLVPLLHAYQTVQIKYALRCQNEPISLMQYLVGCGGSAFLCMSEGRKAMVYDIANGKLMGMCQRVRLSAPPEGWERMFGGGELIKGKRVNAQRYQQGGSGQKLQMSDLSSYENNIPVQRIEAPPPSDYPWSYLPVVEFANVRSSCALSIGSDHVPERTRYILKQAVPVYTFESNDNRNLLMSTGLNPKVLAGNMNSWTVRALILKASQGKVDISASNGPADVLRSMSSTLKTSEELGRTEEYSSDFEIDDE